VVISGPLLRRLLSFGIAGVIGFGVDAGLLYLLAPHVGWYGGRVLSFWGAATATWVINRRFTFAGEGAARVPLWQEYLRYLVAMLGGALFNYAAYVLVLHTLDGRAAPLLGVAAGSIAGMGVNYLSARYLVFRR
jgi:putative flippase GtrA